MVYDKCSGFKKYTSLLKCKEVMKHTIQTELNDKYLKIVKDIGYMWHSEQILEDPDQRMRSSYLWSSFWKVRPHMHVHSRACESLYLSH